MRLEILLTPGLCKAFITAALTARSASFPVLPVALTSALALDIAESIMLLRYIALGLEGNMLQVLPAAFIAALPPGTLEIAPDKAPPTDDFALRITSVPP